MKKHGLGKRLLAMLLVLTMVVGYFPSILANAAKVGDTYKDPTDTNIKGGKLNTNDTIRWPIKIYDYLNDGMLFEYSYAGDTAITEQGGGAYGGGQAMTMIQGDGIIGVDFTSVNGYFKNGSTTKKYAFANWGNKNSYSYNIDTSDQGATEVTRSIGQPVKDVAPMRLHLKYDKNVDKDTKSYGWVSNFAKDDVRYYSKDSLRYLVMVYRTSENFTSHTMKGYWAVADSAYDTSGNDTPKASNADISKVSSKKGWKNRGTFISGEVRVTKSTEWTYVILDMKSNTTDAYGIAKNWSSIKKNTIAGVGLCYPLSNDNEEMDISHIAYFPNEELAKYFGERCVMFDNDPGEYVGRKITMTHKIENGNSVKTTVSRAAAPEETAYNGKLWNMGSNQAFTMLYASKGGGWNGTGGANSENNGYYSYQIGYPYNGGSTAASYRDNAKKQGLDYRVSKSIFLLSTHNTTNTYTDKNGKVCVDMSKLDLGYTLYNTMKDKGVMTAGLLESSQATFIGMDGAERTIMQYKDDTIHYIATMLRDTLVIPERDYYGYNYTFVKGTASSQFCEDVDGDGKLDLYVEDLDGDKRLDAINEDANGNGILDVSEDLDNDGHLDTFEDLDYNGVLDRAEDLDRDGRLDIFEDLDYDGLIDPGEDVDGDGKLDVGEDKNHNGKLDSGEDLNGNGVLDWAHEDRNHNGKLDAGEDLNNNGKLDYWGEDLNQNGKLDKGEDIDGDGRLDVGEDKNHNGALDSGEDLNGNGVLDWAHEDRNHNGKLDAGEDLNNNGKLDYWGEDLNNNGKLDLGEDLDGDGNLDCGEVLLGYDKNGNGKIDTDEDMDDDGNLDVCEDDYLGLGGNSGKLDKCDLASALRKRLGIEFTEAHLKAKTKAAAQKQPNKAKLGSYDETSKKFTAGPNGANQLIGPFLKCAPYIETFYDAAYYILHNTFVPGSYNNVEDDYNYLVMSKATVLSENKEAYVFDAGFTSTDGSASTMYDKEQKLIYQTTAADKWKIYFTSSQVTTMRPFLPINDEGEGMDEEYRYNGSPYVRDDQTTQVNDYGATYALRNYNYVMTANGEFVYHYDDGLFFDFEGDDDVYMFINGELVLDIGAAHSITKVGFNMNDYVKAARKVLGELDGYAAEMDDANFAQVLKDNGVTESEGFKISSGTYKGTYSMDDLKRLHKLNLVDGQSYPIDFYYMERHGWGANMRIATNIVMTDPSMETDKQAYQGTDANGNMQEIAHGGMIDATKPVNYSFSITNGLSTYDAKKKDSNTKLYRLAFQDYQIGVDLSPTNGLQVFGKSTVTTFRAESGAVLDITGLNGIVTLDDQHYRVTVDGNFIRPKADGGSEVTESVTIPASDKTHTLEMYQYNATELFSDIKVHVSLSGSGTPVVPDRNDQGIYPLTVGKVHELPVGGVRVTDANGGILDPSDLTITVSGYASEADFKAGIRTKTVTVKVSNQQELKNFLTNLQDPKGQTGSGEGIPTGKSALYWGAGLWKNATVTISGMWYTMTEEEQAAKVFDNTVYTTGYKSRNSADPLHGQSSHRVYSPGEASYYQWSGHTVNLDANRFWNDFIASSLGEGDPLYEQNAAITNLKNGGLSKASFKIVNSAGSDLQAMDNYYDEGMWKTWPGSTISNTEGYRDIYYKQIHDWSDKETGADKVYVYYWSDANPSMIQWPGVKMTKLDKKTDDEKEVFTQKIPTDAQYVIFSNGINNPINVQTKNITLPVVDYDAVEYDATNKVIKVNYNSVGMHMFYVLVSSSATSDTALVPVSFYVTDLKDRSYVLDYGLRTEDLNAQGMLFRGDELLGTHASTAIKFMGVATKAPSYLGTYSSTALSNNNLNRINFTPATMTAAEDGAQYLQLNDGKFYLGNAIDAAGSPIKYSGGRYTLDKRMWFTPEKVMDEEYNVWIAVTVHFGEAEMGAGMGKYHMPAPSNGDGVTGGEIDIATEVQMYKKITILPATVVYYEDDFMGLNYNGEFVEKRDDKTAGIFVHHGAGSGALTQGVNPDTPYGQDTTYQAAVNDKYSGQTMTTIKINDPNSVASFSFKGTGFELISRTNAFDSASVVVNVFNAIKVNNELVKDGNEPVKRLPVITEFTSSDVVCKHNHHTPNGYCSYCGSKVSHSYTDGICTVCNAQMETYYLIGYINGSDQLTTSDYEFVDGRLNVKFNQDSYVMVRDGSGNQYWTNGYPGDTATSAVLFNVGKYSGQMEANKLHVPGGVELTMNLMDNGKGGLVLSYFREPVNYGERTLYFDISKNGWTTPHIYYWSETNGMMVEWPGVAMNKVEGVENIFSFVVPSDATKVLFNDGVGGGLRQTADQTIPGDHVLYDFDVDTRRGTWIPYGNQEEEEEVITSNTVYFENTAGWENVYVHYWSADNKEMVEFPGELMTLLQEGGTRYKFELPLEATQLLFTAGKGLPQTQDLFVQGDEYLYRNGEWFDSNGLKVEANTKLVYFKNTYDTTPKAYYWVDGNNGSVTWPGTDMSWIPGTDYYYVRVPVEVNRIIFNDGFGTQTADLELKDTTPTYENGVWTDKVPSSAVRPLYYMNTNNWDKVYVYFWSDANGAMTQWSGVEMTKLDSGVFYTEIPADSQYVKFSNGEMDKNEAGIPIGGGKFGNYDYFTNGIWVSYLDPTITVYFRNTSKWSNVKIHYWNDEMDFTTWPGMDMTLVEGEKDLYSFNLPIDAKYVIFNNGEGQQTSDQEIIGNGLVYNNGRWYTLEQEPKPEPVELITVYYKNTNTAWDEVYAYVWGGKQGEYLGGWPGSAMTHMWGDMYSIQIPADAEGIAFNNNNKGLQNESKEIPGDGYTFNGTGWWIYGEEEEPQPEVVELITVYFKNTKTGWSSVHAYVWGGSQGEYLGTWPGTEMTHVEGDVYSIQIPADVEGLSFNDGDGGAKIEVLSIPGDGYAFNGTDWWVYGEEEPQPEPAELITVYFKNTTTAWENVYAYVWGGSQGLYLGAWPGSVMTAVEGNTDYYVIQIPVDADGLIFNDGKDGGEEINAGTIPGDGYAFNGTDWWVYGEEEPQPEVVENITLYFDNTSTGWTNLHAYYWNGDINNGWPGTAMTNVSGNIWSVQVPENMVNIIINNGGDGSQTGDLTIPGDSFLYDGSDWSVYQPAKTLMASGDTVTLYYNNTANGWTNIHAHYWGGSEESTWPGVVMEMVEENLYKVVIPADSTGIIFNNGDNGSQTDNLTVPGDGYEYTGSSWKVYGSEPVGTIKVYYNNIANGWTNIHAHYWGGSEESTWPGVEMEMVEENLFMVIIPADSTSIIFNNGNNGSQTGNLTVPGDGYEYDGSKWKVYGSDDPIVEPISYITLFYDNATNNWAQPYAYYWNDNGNNGWPGIAMTHVSGTIYSVDVPEDMTSIIFNDGGNGNQSDDLTIPGDRQVFDGESWKQYVPSEPETPDFITIYYNNSASGWTEVYVHYQGGSEESQFPGIKMEQVEKHVFKAVIPGDSASVVFSNGSEKTGELNVQGDGYEFDGTGWDVYVPGQGGGDDQPGEEEPEKATDRTLYFQNIHGWAEPYAYILTEDNAVLEQKMVRGYSNYYLFHAPAKAVKVAFVDGKATDAQALFAEGSTSAMDLVADKNLYGMAKSWGKYDDSDAIYFDNANYGWDKVYAHYWNSDGGSNWPGVQMTYVSGTIYKVEVPDGMTNIIFNNGSGSQSSDLTIPARGSVYGIMTWTDMNGTIVFFKNEEKWSEVCITFGNAEANVYVPAPGLKMENLGNDIWSYLVPEGNDVVNFYNDKYTDSIIPESNDTYEDGNWYTFNGCTGKEIQQVPVIRVDGLDYGYYIVEISGMPQYGDNIDWSLLAKLQTIIDEGEAARAELKTFQSQYPDVDWDQVAKLVEQSKMGGEQAATAEEALNKIIADNQIDWATYEKLTGKITEGEEASAQYIKHRDGNTKETYLYIDGFRVFQPLNTSNSYYNDREDSAAFVELRTLILDGKAAVGTYKVDKTTLYTGNYSWTENRNGDFIGSQVETVDDYLTIGPNNETYLNANLDNQAVVFYVKETDSTGNGPAPVRTLQIAARGLDAGLFNKGEAEGVYTTIYQGVYSYNPDGTILYHWSPLTTVLSSTEQYYEVNYGSCPYTVDADGNRIYQVALSVRQGMASITSVKYKGFEILEGLAEESTYELVDGVFVKKENGSVSGGGFESGETNGAPIMNFSAISAQMGADVLTGDTVDLPDTPDVDQPEQPDVPGVPDVPEIGTVVVPTLIPKSATLSFDDLIRYNFYFEASKLDDVVEMGLITFDERLTDGTIYNAMNIYPGYYTAGNAFMVSTDGIEAKRMGDTVFFKIYAKLSDGSYQYSEIRGYSAVAYAKTILNKESASDKMKSLVVAMLNYGAEAQMAFGYNTDNLMNSFLTDDDLSLIPSYQDLSSGALIAADANKAQNFVYNTGDFAKRTSSVSFDSAFSINYYFTAKAQPDNGMKLYYWSQDDYLNTDVLTLSNATGSMDMVATGVGNQYWGQVSDIAAKQIDETVFVVGVYELDGVTYTTGVLSYSIARYCNTLATNDGSNLQGLAKATAIYGECAKEYFN